MGKTWDKYTPKAFQEFSYDWGVEALRVLKPGGYCLAFSGTRTYHRMVCGLEDAGFVIKDQLAWMYGSGFPKSLNISLAVNKHLGGEIEKGDMMVAPDGQTYDKRKKIGHPLTDNCYGEHIVEEVDLYEKVPTHPEALKWVGYGSSLKPAFEPIVLAQKPYENTYAENVLKWNCGGLNIDASRIQYQANGEYPRVYNGGMINIARKASEHTVSFPPLPMKYAKPNGRYPSNVLLSHHHECKVVGTKEVGSGKVKHNQEIKRQELEDLDLTSFTSETCGFKSNKGQGLGNYGVEEVKAYSCHPDCPVRLLDEQSGQSKSPNQSRSKNTNTDFGRMNDDGWTPKGHIIQGHNDKGGASRFFKTFSGETRFIYSGKAHKSERNAGLDELEDRQCIGGGGTYNAEAGRKFGSIKSVAKNDIATLKPINVMRYLVRLVCPKGGVVLDPFGGSGTTGIACIIEGMDYILIEKRERFAKVIIPKRLEFWKNPDNWLILKEHNALPKPKDLRIKKQNRGLSNWI